MLAAALSLGLAFLAAAGPGGAAPGSSEPDGEERAAPPLPWREPAPPARLFLQLPFEAPALVEAGSLHAEVQLAYANSILVAASPSLALDVDMESAELLGLLRYRLWPALEAQLGIPVIADYGGFLDGPIEAVERLLGATAMPGRLGRPHGLTRFRLTRPDGSGLWRDGPGAGLGDVWGALKARLADGAGGLPAVSVRAALKAPTGRPPYGSGEVDLGASLSAGWALPRLGLWLELDAIAPTAGLRQVRLPTRAYGAAQLGAAVAVGGSVWLHAQWATHLSPYARTGLSPLDETTHYLLAGASLALSRSLRLEAAAVENVFSPAWGADFTLLLALRGADG